MVWAGPEGVGACDSHQKEKGNTHSGCCSTHFCPGQCQVKVMDVQGDAVPGTPATRGFLDEPAPGPFLRYASAHLTLHTGKGPRLVPLAGLPRQAPSSLSSMC